MKLNSSLTDPAKATKWIVEVQGCPRGANIEVANNRAGQSMPLHQGGALILYWPSQSLQLDNRAAGIATEVHLQKYQESANRTWLTQERCS